jgi:cobalt-precorrin-5B (C1)-methyltransferase
MRRFNSYTTGVYTTALFKSAFTNELYPKIALPNRVTARVKIDRIKKSKHSIYISTTKAKNRDIDVTIGAKISLKLYKKPQRYLIEREHKPIIFRFKRFKVSIFASSGVGVVTKDGLKIEKGYPAINPIPQKLIKEALKQHIKRDYFAYLSVKDGEKIAKNSANEQVGVIGGISILGTTGVVKPLSSSAYLDSIKTQIDVVDNYYSKIILTLGESAYRFAKRSFEIGQIIEIGNYVFDSIEYIEGKKNISEILFITAIAKMTKLSQGFKNTHNRYGFIDFEKLNSRYSLNMNMTEVATIRAVLERLPKEKQEALKREILKDSLNILRGWSSRDISILISS